MAPTRARLGEQAGCSGREIRPVGLTSLGACRGDIVYDVDEVRDQSAGDRPQQAREVFAGQFSGEAVGWAMHRLHIGFWGRQLSAGMTGMAPDQ